MPGGANNVKISENFKERNRVGLNMVGNQDHLYKIGDFTVYEKRREVKKAQESKDLPEKAFLVLLLLLQKPGEFVLNVDLMDAVWGTCTEADENSLRNCIFRIREIFGNNAVLNRRNQGYRFVLHVIEVSPPRNLSDLEEDPFPFDAADIAAAERRMNREGWAQRVLEPYYSNIPDAGVALRAFECNGVRFASTIAARSDWIDLSCDLRTGPECSEFLPSKGDLTTLAPAEVIAEFKRDPKSFLGLSEIDERHLDRCLSWFMGAEADLKNLPTYRVMDVDSRNPMHISFKLEPYLRYRLGIGLLEEELALALHDTGFDDKRILSDMEGYLPLRKLLLPNAASLLDFKRQIRVAGVHVMFAMARRQSKDFGVLIQQRSGKVTSGRGTRAVIPSGHHQSYVNPTQEVQLSTAVYREFYEELLQGKEAEGPNRRLDPDPRWFMTTHDALKYFLDDQSSFSMMCCSLGTNLAHGTVSANILLAISDEWYWEEYHKTFEGNFEVDKLEIISTVNEGELREVITDINMSSSGRACLIDGLLALKRSEPDRVKLPSIKRLLGSIEFVESP
jgi:DNA-binding winged helix-turn-helix (wHTH) protein